MDPVTDQKKNKPRKLSKRAKRSRVQHQRKERALEQITTLHELMLQTSDLERKRSYVKHMRLLAQKVQLQLPFSLKNSFCRRCSEVFSLEPVRTYTVRLHSKPEPMIVYTCLRCGYKRKKIYVKNESS